MPEPASEPIRLPDVLETEYAALGRSIPTIERVELQDDPTRLMHIRKHLHRQQPLSALCISGGGIRSATFGLGAMQGLAKLGLLEQFDYLSTVSGGGYIGSWFTSWARRLGTTKDVSDRLSGRCLTGPCDMDPIEHLREFNNYLTPKLGLGSADTWTLAAIVTRNLLLNWLLLIPLLLCVTMAPRLIVSLMEVGDLPYEDQIDNALLVVAMGMFAIANFNLFRYMPSVGNVKHAASQFVRNLFIPLVLSGVLMLVFFWWTWYQDAAAPSFLLLSEGAFAVSMGTWLVYLICTQLFKDPRRFARLLFGPISLALLIGAFMNGASAFLLTSWLYPPSDAAMFTTFGPPLFLLGPLVGGVLFVGFSSSVLQDGDREWSSRVGAYVLQFIFAWTVLCSLVLLLPTAIFQLAGWAKSSLVALGGVSGWITSMMGRSPKIGPKQQEDGGSPILTIAGKVALPVFLCCLFAGISILANGLMSILGLTKEHWTAHRAVLENSNVGNTLLLTILLAGFAMIMARFINANKFSLHGMYRNRLVRAYLAASNSTRIPNLFTGFDDNDNVNMKDLRAQRPLHVTNQALNLVSGKNLAWQQRKAQSFTVTPFFAGNYDLGYRDSEYFGGCISLGTAMTISGAAASPNMGYHSSPLVGFTMMLFNARLGSWLGNPGLAGRETWKHDGPHTAVGSVVREALGLTDNTGPYVYLSDGGHFENLALYEMILRRVRHIVVLDSGCDADLIYEDLGNALRKIRIDFGIPIEFEDDCLRPLRNRVKRCAIANIRYSAIDPEAQDGVLLYIKPILLKDEPPDVQSYSSSSATFPHETTNDQWFTEAQTESYRMLAEYTFGCMAQGWKGKTLEEFLAHVKHVYLGVRAPESQSAGV